MSCCATCTLHSSEEAPPNRIILCSCCCERFATSNWVCWLPSPYDKGEFFGVTQVRRLDDGLGYKSAYADMPAGRVVVASSLHVLVHRF